VLAVRWFAFVVMTVVFSVQVPVMDVVDVAVVRDSDVSTLLTVAMVMSAVLGMGRCAGHLKISLLPTT